LLAIFYGVDQWHQLRRPILPPPAKSGNSGRLEGKRNLFFLAVIEVYVYFRTTAIIDRTAYSVGNLVAQEAYLIDDSTDTSSNDIGAFWQAAPLTAAPLSLTTSGSVIITEIDDANSGKSTTPQPQIAWSRQSTWGTGDKSALSTSNPLPSGFPFNSGDNTVVVEVFYHFSPFYYARTFWPGAPTTIVFHRTMYFHPRYQSLATLQQPS